MPKKKTIASEDYFNSVIVQHNFDNKCKFCGEISDFSITDMNYRNHEEYFICNTCALCLGHKLFDGIEKTGGF